MIGDNSDWHTAGACHHVIPGLEGCGSWSWQVQLLEHLSATLGPKPEATYPGLPVRSNLPLAAVQAAHGNDFESSWEGQGRGKCLMNSRGSPACFSMHALETGPSSCSVSDCRHSTPHSLIKHHLHRGRCQASTFPVVTLKASSQEQVNKNEKLQSFGLTSSHCHAPQNTLKFSTSGRKKQGRSTR